MKSSTGVVWSTGGVIGKEWCFQTTAVAAALPTRGHRCCLPSKTHDRASSAGACSSCRRRRRTVLLTAIGHSFTRPLHLLHDLQVVGLHITLFAHTSENRYCVLFRASLSPTAMGHAQRRLFHLHDLLVTDQSST